HSTFQDVAVSARYRLGDDPWAVTPVLRYVRPSHDYRFQGEAVVGKNLSELQLGLTAGLKLTPLLPQASIGAGYTYALVDRVAGISLDRSNAYVELGYSATRRLYVRALGTW